MKLLRETIRQIIRNHIVESIQVGSDGMIAELGQTVDEIKNYPNMHSFAINYFDDCQTQISFEIDDPNTIWISTLYTTSRGNPYPTPSNKTECLGKGGARKMMQIFCDLADKYKVKLHMNASPIGEKHMSGKQLHNFYSSFGFIGNKGDYMAREPR